jgi:hypothetical protein
MGEVHWHLLIALPNGDLHLSSDGIRNIAVISVWKFGRMAVGGTKVLPSVVMSWYSFLQAF